MIHRLGRLPERLRTWRYGRQISELCMAYGGKMSDGETRVCGKWRGHLDSHAYDRIDEVLRPRGWCERDGVLIQVEHAWLRPGAILGYQVGGRVYDPDDVVIVRQGPA